MEKILAKQLLPTVFQPICNRRFIFCLYGLDSFLVKKVERPSYVRPDRSWSKTDRELLNEQIAHKRLIVTLHDAIAPSTRQQVQELINDLQLTSTEVQIKLLDPVGTVVGLQTYQNVIIERVDYPALDYADGQDVGEIRMVLSYNKEKLKY